MEMGRFRLDRHWTPSPRHGIQLLVLTWATAGSWLAGCACSELGGSDPPGQPPSDASTADGDSDAQSCSPRVCTPCECGPTDDGCGQVLDCGPCPELKDCTDIYGSVDDFELCEQTDDHCSFSVTKNGRSCAAICIDQGGQCLATYGNGVGCETVYEDVDLGCQAADHVDDVCVCTRMTDCYVPLPLDAAAEDGGPPTGTTLLYRVNYEGGTIDANPGASHAETMSGGAVTVVANPAKDGRNNSDQVGRHAVPTGYTRAELSSQRLPTVDHTYIYRWSYYVPPGFFDSDISWNLISQWKTWPCGDHDGYDAEICGSCGIFNDLSIHTDSFHFKYRAEPDCFTASPTLITGQWVDFVSEIRWTNGNTGYVKLWQNGQLAYEQQGMKTLFDNFNAGSCNMYWAVGLYSSNTGGLAVYTDNIEIWEY